ncbi:MAG: hypothetical protein HFE60_11735 [Anaerotignum sp.]|nr:hypothetical protein [Anaerotignum sp.]
MQIAQSDFSAGKDSGRGKFCHCQVENAERLPDSEKDCDRKSGLPGLPQNRKIKIAKGNLWIYGGLLLIAAALTMTAGHFQDAKRAAESAAVLTVEVGAVRPVKNNRKKKARRHIFKRRRLKLTVIFMSERSVFLHCVIRCRL